MGNNWDTWELPMSISRCHRTRLMCSTWSRQWHSQHVYWIAQAWVRIGFYGSVEEQCCHFIGGTSKHYSILSILWCSIALDKNYQQESTRRFDPKFLKVKYCRSKFKPIIVASQPPIMDFSSWSKPIKTIVNIPKILYYSLKCKQIYIWSH